MRRIAAVLVMTAALVACGEERRPVATAIEERLPFASTTSTTAARRTTTTSTTAPLSTTTTTTIIEAPRPTTTPNDCHPSYDPCVPHSSDVDCAGGSGNGPAYTGRVSVVGPDEYDLDRDGDGVGCEP